MPDEAYIEVQVGGHRPNSRRGVALVDVDDGDTEPEPEPDPSWRAAA
jgi:hypothetical protein